MHYVLADPVFAVRLQDAEDHNTRWAYSPVPCQFPNKTNTMKHFLALAAVLAPLSMLDAAATPTIQQQIDAAVSAGKPSVRIEPGVYRTAAAEAAIGARVVSGRGKPRRGRHRRHADLRQRQPGPRLRSLPERDVAGIDDRLRSVAPDPRHHRRHRAGPHLDRRSHSCRVSDAAIAPSRSGVLLGL